MNQKDIRASWPHISSIYVLPIVAVMYGCSQTPTASPAPSKPVIAAVSDGAKESAGQSIPSTTSEIKADTVLVRSSVLRSDTFGDVCSMVIDAADGSSYRFLLTYAERTPAQMEFIKSNLDNEAVLDDAHASLYLVSLSLLAGGKQYNCRLEPVSFIELPHIADTANQAMPPEVLEMEKRSMWFGSLDGQITLLFVSGDGMYTEVNVVTFNGKSSELALTTISRGNDDIYSHKNLSEWYRKYK